MTAFAELPDLGNGFRMVGSQLMDEEQFLTERWHEDRGTWRCSIEGIHRYAEIRASRKADRHEAWKSRQDSDDEYSNEMARLIEDNGMATK